MQVVDEQEVCGLAASDSTALRYETSDPDVRLMLQVRDDNAAAFEELVLRYQSRLLTVLEHLVRNRELAEDLTQDVFLRVYRARKSYSAGAKFSTWLFTIAKNVASNARRKRAGQREFNVTPDHNEDTSAQPMERLAIAASGLLPTRRLDKTELADILRLAMESLTEQQRMALLLSKFEDMSYADISEAMGLSVQAVKSVLWRARESLREILEPYMQEGTRPPGGQDE